MKSCLPALLLLVAAFSLFTGCQTTDSSSVWRRPEYYGAPKKSVAVAVLAYRKETRMRLEEALVADLRQRGVNARVTYPLIDTQTLVSNKAAAIERAKATGVEAILAVRMVDLETLKIYQFPASNTGTGLPPWQNWFDFFQAKSAYATNPSMAEPGNAIGVMATFYENPTGVFLWSYTFAPKVTGSTAQLDPISTTIVKKLQASALIP